MLVCPLHSPLGIPSLTARSPAPSLAARSPDFSNGQPSASPFHIDRAARPATAFQEGDPYAAHLRLDRQA